MSRNPSNFAPVPEYRWCVGLIVVARRDVVCYCQKHGTRVYTAKSHGRRVRPQSFMNQALKEWERRRCPTLLCTDCGADTDSLRETQYQVRPSVWEKAFPGYGDGEGVGECRPCIACLEKRLGRKLTHADFTKGNINHPDPARHSERLITRLTSHA